MRFLTLEDVAIQLHWTPGTARNRISRGESMPPYIKIGHRLLFPVPDFEMWINNHIVCADIKTRPAAAKIIRGKRGNNGLARSA